MVEQKLDQGARLSGPLLEQKACELACTQGTDCTPSDGWLTRWKVDPMEGPAQHR